VRTFVTRSDPNHEPPLPARLDPRAGKSQARRSDPRPAGAERAGRLAILTRAMAGISAVAVLAMSGWGWYLGEVADATVNRTDAIPTSGNEGVGSGEAMNLLLVGSDSRARLTPEQARELHTGSTPGQNTDTMILVHVPADGTAASFVSFPRDSYVEIPDYGWDKLNAAYAYGHAEPPEGADESVRQAAGAQLLIRTISKLSGLQIDHYAEVDLLGFFTMANVVGGVEVNLCEAVSDSYSGIDMPAGKQTISGEQALAFVRQRHGLPRGDYDRIVRQQTFIAGMIRKMLDQNVLLDLGKQRELVGAAAQALTVDRSLDLLGLAGQMQQVTAGNIEFQTVPLVGDERDAQGRFITRLPDLVTLHAFFADLTAEPEPAPEPEEPTEPAAPETVDPSAVTVDVFNGSGISGLAAETSAGLAGQGFGAGTTGNADSADYTTTEIRHAAGEQALANTVAAAIPGATVVEADDVPAGHAHLVIGSDFNGVGQPVTAAESSGASDGTAEETEAEDHFTAADTDCIY
jgi:LCP family protein required for cell wall assembly